MTLSSVVVLDELLVLPSRICVTRPFENIIGIGVDGKGYPLAFFNATYIGFIDIGYNLASV